ncbi:MAG: SRPBCC domain-containing protein [Gordonia paraffinivorans]
MSDDELVIVRTIRAPVEVVFDCMTSAEHLSHFWGPMGTSTPRDGIVVEPWAGGRFETRIVGDRDGSVHHMRAVFESVDRPTGMTWRETGSGMVCTASFRALDVDRTEMTVTQRHVPEAGRTRDAQQGFLSSLDRFDDHLDRILRGGGR